MTSFNTINPDGNTIYNTGSDVKPGSTTSSDKIETIKGHLGKMLDSVHRFGIFVTGAAPFSTRGLFFKLAISPILIPIRLVQSASSPDFSKAMKEHMRRDWNDGIQDFYIDLEGDDDKTEMLREKIIGENRGYAAYMMAGNSLYDMAILLDREMIMPEPKPITEIREKLKEMGFEYDKGIYYHMESGNMFELVYDEIKNEVVLCFPGLGNEDKIGHVEDQWGNEKHSILLARRIIGIGAEHLGGIPFASTQAIEIGKMIKNVTKDSDPPITPVMVGHSHGGAIAQCAAVANGLKGVVFNSRPMGAGTRRYIGQTTVAKNAAKITAFSGKDDWLSGNKALNVLAILFERVTGIPVPRTVGVGYHLPEVGSDDATENHVNFFKGISKLENLIDINVLEARRAKHDEDFFIALEKRPNYNGYFGWSNKKKEELRQKEELGLSDKQQGVGDE